MRGTHLHLCWCVWEEFLTEGTYSTSFNIFKYAYDYSSLVCAINIYLLLWSKYTGVFCPFSHLFAQTDLSQKLSLCSKLCFAIGGAPKEVAASATGFFLQIYLLDVAQVSALEATFTDEKMSWYGNVCLWVPACPCCAPQINAFQASMVLFIGKVWGAVTDPVVGFFITKSKWTRIGRLMPWWDPLLSLHKLIQESWNDNLFPVWWNFKNWLCILINASWYHWQRHSLRILPIKHTNTKWIHKCVPQLE